MASPEQLELWTKIAADLRRALATLSPEAANDASVRDYQDFLDHNELELACDMLESYADGHAVTREFWLALRDASTKMQLHDRAMHFDSRAAAG